MHPQKFNQRIIKVETAGGIIELRVREDEQVSVDMGVPRLVPEKIPFASLKNSRV